MNQTTKIAKPGNRHLLEHIVDPFRHMRTYWLLFAAFALIYLFIQSSILANLIPHASYDDGYYYTMAENLLARKWLGSYHSILLSKMPAYAFFLAGCIGLGIPYMLLIGLCHTIAVAYFLRTSLWLFEKAKLLSFIMGICLLFNPIFASCTRIYRDQFSAICFLIFIGTIAAMFQPKKEKIPWFESLAMAIISFFGIGLLFFAREETLLYAGMLTLSVIAYFLLSLKKLSHWKNLKPMAFGLLGVLIFGLSISVLNNRFYGVFTVCEKTSGAYPKAMRAFQLVDDPWQDKHIPKISPSHQKIEQISNLIPEFEKVASIMTDPSNQSFKKNAMYFNADSMHLVKLDNKYIPASHFEWYWILALNKAGYYSSASQAAVFQNSLHEKISELIITGKLESRDFLFSFGPYFMVKQDLGTSIKAIPKHYSEIFFRPKSFQKKLYHFSINPSNANSDPQKLNYWQKTLRVNYLQHTDEQNRQLAKNSLHNRIWNFVVWIFSWLMAPAFHVTIPMAILSVILAIRNKAWSLSAPIIVITVGFAVHFLLLNVITVVVGYKAAQPRYFLPSYGSIIAICFISLAVFIRQNISKKKYIEKETN